MTHYEVRAPAAAKRKLVTIVIGTQSPVVTHHWSCPVCAFITRGGDQDRARIVKEMRAHDCDAGWCPWSPPPGTQRPAWPVPEAYVPPHIAHQFQSREEARRAVR